MQDDFKEQLNFCLPLKVLESDRVVVTPFIPSVHAKVFVDAASLHPELFRYWPFGPFPTLSHFLQFYESIVFPDKTFVLFAIFDKTHPDPGNYSPPLPGTIAGITGLLNTSIQHSSTEIGCIAILPEFQRTHVNRNQVGLLLHYCLDLPEKGGLGLRRVQWQAHAENAPSVRAAESIGFLKEGIIRWQKVLPLHKEGTPTREGDPMNKGSGRHTALLAICWDDWESGVREKVDSLMKRGSA